MRKKTVQFRSNARFARAKWGKLSNITLQNLKELTVDFSLSLAGGDIQFLNGKWYVTHSGLLRIASRRRCFGINSALVESLSDPLACRWVFKATVYKSRNSCGFVAYGDADPSNTSPLVRGAEMRVSETRAVNRALRKAYGVGICSVEELGWLSEPEKVFEAPRNSNGSHNSIGSNSNPTRLRDQLCLLIRQHNLDPILVKAYAADFCGTQTIKDASRDLVESFISHLAASAKGDRDGLVCKLNSFAQPVEVNQ